MAHVSGDVELVEGPTAKEHAPRPLVEVLVDSVPPKGFIVEKRTVLSPHVTLLPDGDMFLMHVILPRVLLSHRNGLLNALPERWPAKLVQNKPSLLNADWGGGLPLWTV
jgi:hypothetical protein